MFYLDLVAVYTSLLRSWFLKGLGLVHVSIQSLQFNVSNQNVLCDTKLARIHNQFRIRKLWSNLNVCQFSVSTATYKKQANATHKITKFSYK